MANIHLVVGSVMGTALKIAEYCSILLVNHTVRINSAFRPGQLNPNEILLVCTSNTGVGDLPHNILPLLVHLTNDYPAIAGLRYGIINIGDSSYPSFAQAGQKIDEALIDIGAVRVGEPLVIDNQENDDPKELTRQWLKTWESYL